jgi:membrane protein
MPQTAGQLTPAAHSISAATLVAMRSATGEERVRTAYVVAIGAVRSFVDDQAGSFAAAFAYYTLLSIFPLAIFLISISGYFMTASQRDALIAHASDLLPGASAGAIAGQINTVTNGRAGLGTIGLVFTLWSASAVFSALRAGLTAVWKVRRGRPWVLAKALDLASVVGLGAMLALSLASTILLTTISGAANQWLGDRFAGLIAFAFSTAIFLLPAALAFATLWVLYALASPLWIHWRNAWLGALVGAIGFQVVSFGFSVYLRYFSHYDRVYGALGAVIAFLFYAYLVGCVILLGAEVIARYVELRSAGTGTS